MPIELSLGTILNFVLGMVTGMILFSAIYVYFFVRGKNITIDEIKHPNVEVKEEELKKIIVEKQKKFKRNRKLGVTSVTKLTFDMSYELIEEISKYFFPNSKYPMLELSVNEFITLNHYVTDRIDQMLNKPLLKNTKNVRVTKFVQMYDKKKSIERNKVIKSLKKYKVDKAAKYASMTVNVMNPVYWFRKAVIKTSVDAMTKKISVVIIGIVGEETVKVYSKKLFDKELEIDVVDEDIKLLQEGKIKEDETD
jgi:hypothetical protein